MQQGVIVQKPQNSSFTDVISKSKIDTPIDIMVPVHGRLDLTMKCLKALYENTTVPFHLIILDDTVDDPDDPDSLIALYLARFMKHHDNITYIHKDEPYKCGNQFYNEGLKHCKYDYVASVMNSVTVEPDWELVAIQFMNNNPTVGIIGLKTLLPSGVIETAGITMMGFTPIDIGRDQPGYKLTCMHECIAVQWAFALHRKAAVEGNIDEDIFYGFVGWDDIDNSFAVRSKGWKIWYCGLGVGIHEVRATRGTNTIEAMEKNRHNAEVFYKRWGYWDLYQKANASDSIHLKSKVAQEIQGLSFNLRSQKKKIDKAVI